VMYFDQPAEDSALIVSSDATLRWVLSANALALLVLGVFQGPLLDWCLRGFGG